jgi:hypothetical protein
VGELPVSNNVTARQVARAAIVGLFAAGRWTPSLLVLGWFLLRRRTPEDQPNNANKKPA